MRAALLALSLAACDPAAKMDAKAQGSPDPIGSSAPYESCAASDDCADGLRCVNATCQVPRLPVADYHAAQGRAALAEGALARSAAAYSTAVRAYEGAELDAPADLKCEQGRALLAARLDPEQAEAAARALHACLLAAPAGSDLYRGALEALAELRDVGLDPGHLASEELVDRYLSRHPAASPLDRLELSVRGDGSRSRTTFVAVVERLGDDASKARLAPCWEANWKQTRSDTMTVKIPVSYRLRIHEDDPSRDRGQIEVEPGERVADPALAVVQTCVRGIATDLLEDTARSLKADERWESLLTIKLERT